MSGRLAAVVLSGVLGTGGAFALPTPGQELAAAQIARLAATCLPDQESVVTATAVALAESSGQPAVHGDTTITDGVWGDSVGLWQVRSLNGQTGTGASRDVTRLEDPAFNAQSMCEISGGGTNWQPWSVYTNGAYLSRLDEARAALAGGAASVPQLPDLTGTGGQASDDGWPSLGDVAEGLWQQVGDGVHAVGKAVNKGGTPELSTIYASTLGKVEGTYAVTPAGGRTFTPAQSATLAGSEGLQPYFVQRLAQLVAAAPGSVTISSGYRTTAEQQAIVDNHGGECGVWVACVRDGVCGSQHCKGLAADLTYENAATQQWVNDHAGDFGLTFPLSWEDWHIEPMGARS